MKVLITGGAGFLGQRLASALLQRGSLTASYGPEPIESITILDMVAPAAADPRIRQVVGDISNRSALERAMDAGPTAVFHLAAIVSGMAESNLDLGMRINVEGTRLLLELCRHSGVRPRFVFTSSVAVFGGGLPETVLDTTPVNPQTSYGVRKRSASCWSATIRGAGSSMAARCGCRRSASARASPTPRRRLSRAA